MKNRDMGFGDNAETAEKIRLEADKEKALPIIFKVIKKLLFNIEYWNEKHSDFKGVDPNHREKLSTLLNDEHAIIDLQLIPAPKGMEEFGGGGKYTYNFKINGLSCQIIGKTAAYISREIEN